MADGQVKPKLRPPVRFWYEDQPEDEAPRLTPYRGEPTAYGNLRHIDDTYLEISRAETLIKGNGVLAGVIASVGSAGAFYFALLLFGRVENFIIAIFF